MKFRTFFRALRGSSEGAEPSSSKRESILEQLTPRTPRELHDCVVSVTFHAPPNGLSMEFGTFEEEYASMERGVEQLRKRFGNAKSDQLLEMMRQAKAHYDANDGLGTRLLQDVEMVILNREPFAYPKRLYRWPRPPERPDPDLIPLTPTHDGLLRELQLIMEVEHEYPGYDTSEARGKFSDRIRSKRERLGADLADQLLDMMVQMEIDFRDGKPGLGGGLMVDISRILCGLSAPWHYPKERYRWPASRNLRPKRRKKKL